MQSSAWFALFRQLPSEQHTNLVLTTTNGTEIYVQGVVRIEAEFLVLRARLGGSTDQGKIMVVPFDQLHFFGFREAVKEADAQAMFEGQPPVPEKPAANGHKARPTPEGVVHAHGWPTEAALAAPVLSPLRTGNPAPILPGKAALLERLRRARAAHDTPPAGGK